MSAQRSQTPWTASPSRTSVSAKKLATRAWSNATRATCRPPPDERCPCRRRERAGPGSSLVRQWRPAQHRALPPRAS
eukprot:6574900-Lingulodinium_polyedra.AAC.1